MSTFNGFIREFPEIRADFFRPLDNHPPALAYFLSHVHSDHLQGLETFKSTFIYCSPATREMLLRLKKYSSRLNYANGILENPHTQTYKHLAKVLKPIPLDTPTILELRPGHKLQVTLLDANHCVGAVMFLFEGDGKAVLYTGDIRCEPFFVSNIARNPSMIEYSSGLKTLDRIYLDTSMLENVSLQTKADGLAELLRKVSRYPEDTIFHFHAWTFGYEDVWIALSKALNSKIHVDKYKLDIYKSLATKPNDQRFASQTHLAKEAPYLAGFTCGNTQHTGCLTLDENVRIHSCEKNMGCSVTVSKPVVWIQPVVAHLENGQDMAEVGIGGGGGDLTEKTSIAAEDLIYLLKLIYESQVIPKDRQKEMVLMLKKALFRNQDLSLDIDVTSLSEEATLERVIEALSEKIQATNDRVRKPEEQGNDHTTLPNVIRFPWARHSFLPELRNFVATFKPKDIYPCTVDISWLRRNLTIRSLFGDCCSGDEFDHDKLMEQVAKSHPYLSDEREDEDETDSERTRATSIPALSSPPGSLTIPAENRNTKGGNRGTGDNPPHTLHSQPAAAGEDTRDTPSHQAQKRSYDSFEADEHRLKNDDKDADDASTASDTDDEELDNIEGDDSQASALSARAYDTRRRAYHAARSNALGESSAWATIGLISTTDHHSFVDEELGSKE